MIIGNYTNHGLLACISCSSRPVVVDPYDGLTVCCGNKHCEKSRLMFDAHNWNAMMIAKLKSGRRVLQ